MTRFGNSWRPVLGSVLVGFGGYVLYRLVTKTVGAIERRRQDDAVDRASEDSFPASDAPSTGR